MASSSPHADSTAQLPNYLPVPEAALGPALNQQGYFVGRVERNLTIGAYHLGEALTATPQDLRVMIDIHAGSALWLNPGRGTVHANGVAVPSCTSALARGWSQPPAWPPTASARRPWSTSPECSTLSYARSGSGSTPSHHKSSTEPRPGPTCLPPWRDTRSHPSGDDVVTGHRGRRPPLRRRPPPTRSPLTGAASPFDRRSTAS
jgi:hypothetical protein